MEQGSLVASGKIFVAESGNFFYEELRSKNPEPTEDEIILEAQDVYKDFRLRGYDYGKEFRFENLAFIRSNFSNSNSFRLIMFH